MSAKRWATANCGYGDEEHVKLMRDGWEPFSVVAIPTMNQITREMSFAFVAFLKKEVSENEPEQRTSDSGLISGV
jgi:hypothetical protein